MAHILVVDDDQVLQRLLEALLRKEGHTIVSAENGYAALEKLSREVFDLIISDANMPGGLSGFELVATIKKDKTLLHIPVIFLTGRGQKADVVRARQVGVSDYIIKPVNHQMLIQKVFTLVQQAEEAKPLVPGDVGAKGTCEFRFRIFDITENEIGFLSPVALPEEFQFKIQSDLFSSIGIAVPMVKIVQCVSFKTGDESFRITAQLLGLKVADLDLIEAWIAGAGVEKSSKSVA